VKARGLDGRWGWLAGLAGGLVLAAGVARAGEPPKGSEASKDAVAAPAGGSPNDLVAVVDGTPITREALESAVEASLVELRLKEDSIRRQALDDLVASELFEKEAAARGVSVSALEKTEILDRSVVTPEEARSFYEANKARFGTTSEAVALQQIVAGLGRQREAQRRDAFARELRGRYDVKVLLEPYRVPVAVGDAPVRGNPEAPVTVVEFSDFQCPYCARARSTVKRIREVYGQNVRWVFRHFPLGFHTSAPKAGEAAACAGDQGHFWEMHDRLFSDQSKLGVADLKASAVAIGLDASAFNQCLDSGRHADLVASDTEAGSRYGVSATPAFFINGRPVIGAQPFEAFARVIDEELDRLGLPAVASAKGAPGGR